MMKRPTKECTIVMNALSSDDAQTFETVEKKRFSSQTVVVRNNNPDWHCLNKRMQCQLCEKKTVVENSLVRHYVNCHPNNEVFPCRVAPDVADFLRNSTEVHKVHNLYKRSSLVHERYKQLEFKQRCYFCNKEKSLTKFSWINHTSVHSGDYRYKCSDCNKRFNMSPELHVCKGSGKSQIETVLYPHLKVAEIFGYLCDFCNLIRFEESEMVTHLRCEHEGNLTTKFKKFTLLNFPKKKREVESNMIEHKRTNTAETLYNVDAELQDIPSGKVRRTRVKNLEAFERSNSVQEDDEIASKDKEQALDPLACDEGISIGIRTQTDDDYNMEQNIPKEKPMEKIPSSRTTDGNVGGSSSNADSTNNGVEMDGLNCPTKVVTRIFNIGYSSLIGNGITFCCFIFDCEYETMDLGSFLSHYEDHKVDWGGFCMACNAQVNSDQITLMMEFKHMTEAHLNKKDKLSKLKEAEIAARDKQLTTQSTSASVVSENSFFKIANVPSTTTTTVTKPDISPFVIVNAMSAGAAKQDYGDCEVVELKQWARNRALKQQKYYKRMMRDISLFALYKCMDIKCSFTTSDSEHMLTHLRNHENDAILQANNVSGADIPSYLECAYCDDTGDSCQWLVKHIQDEHQSSIFQCPYCFYRSCAAYNVVVHLSQFHQSEQKSVLVCNGKPKGYATEKALIEKSRQEFVRPLRCTEDCKKITFVMDYFVAHMKTSPAHSDKFKCHVCGCNVPLTTAAAHLLCHRIGVFQCVYCQFGTNDVKSIQHHMCNSHPSKLLYICVRLMRKSQVLTDEQLSSVESTLTVHLGQSVDAKLFQRCPYTEQQLSMLSSSIEKNAVSLTQPSSSLSAQTQIDIEITAATRISNETFSNPSSSSLGLMLGEILSYKDFEKEYVSDDYDKYFANIALPSLPEQPTTSKCKRKSSSVPVVVKLPENTRKRTTPTSRTDLLQDEIDVAAHDLVRGTGLEGSDLYRCGFEDCDEKCNDILAFDVHLLNHNSPLNEYKCYHCSTVFINIDGLSYHIQMHGIHRYFCYFCNHTSAINSVQKHMQDIHSSAHFNSIALNPKKFDRNKDMFIVSPGPRGLCQEELKQFRRSLMDRNKRKLATTKKFCSPGDIEVLPRQTIDPVNPIPSLDTETTSSTPTHNAPIGQQDDSNKIKHIRGILLEEENIRKTSAHQKDQPKGKKKNFKKKRPDKLVIEKNIAAADVHVISESESDSIDNNESNAIFVISDEEVEIASGISTSTTNSNPIPSTSKNLIDSDKRPLGSNINALTEPNTKAIDSISYNCFYCFFKVRNPKLIYKHWNENHKFTKIVPPNIEIPGRPFMFCISKTFQCYHCRYASVTFSDLKIHSQRNHPKNTFTIIDNMDKKKCRVCSHEFVNVDKEIVQHFKEAHRIASVSSNNEPIDFLTDEFVNEIIAILPKQQVRCTRCDVMFSSVHELDSHTKEKHGDTEMNYEILPNDPIMYSCSKCRETNCSETAMIEHIRGHLMQYQCKFCDKHFDDLQLVKQHHEIMHKTKDETYRNIDVENNIEPYLLMKIIFPNGFVLTKGQAKYTRYGGTDEVIQLVTELNEKDLEEVRQRQVNNRKDSERNEPLVVKKNAKTRVPILSVNDDSDCDTKACSKPKAKLKKRRKFSQVESDSDSVDSSLSIREMSPIVTPSNTVKKMSGIARKKTTSTHISEDKPLTKLIPYSFYGKKSRPVNLSKVFTQMQLGDSEIRVSCDRFALLVNMNPKLRLKRCTDP